METLFDFTSTCPRVGVSLQNPDVAPLDLEAKRDIHFALKDTYPSIFLHTIQVTEYIKTIQTYRN